MMRNPATDATTAPEFLALPREEISFTVPRMLLYVALLLFPALVGLPIAAWGYPWRKPVVRPYLWFALVLAAPLAVVVLLQALFGLPPGSCVERPLNDAPFWLAGLDVLIATVLLVRARGYRRFVAGLAVALCPPTLMWALVATMSLAGCWI